MSSDIKSARELTNDPYGKLLNALAKKFSAFVSKDQAELVENPEDIFADGQDVDSVLKWHNFVMTKKFDLTTQFYSAADPDLDKLRLWIIGKNLGNEMRDFSEFGREITIRGDPTLVDGAPFDWGIVDGTLNTKSIAMRFNRPTAAGLDYLRVTHDNAIRVSEALSAGISFFIRFRVFDLAQQGGANITLFEKTDDTTTPTPQSGVKVELDSSGRIKFMIRNTATNYSWETATGTVVINTVYDVWFTYNKTGNVVHIYVNNVDKTLSAGVNLAWHSNLADRDLYIMRRGGGSDTGLVYGDLYDYRLYRERIISATQVGYMWANKWTIANIPFGQVLISNYAASVSAAAAPSSTSFTSTSFTSTSFTT